MTVAKRLSHRRAARRDLLEIWRFSSSTWSEEQADSYLAGLDQLVLGLASGAVAGTPHGADYKRLRFRSHIVFYRETARDIVIVRVLHSRMDVARHLS